MGITTWYFARNDAKHARQIVLQLTPEKEVPSSVGNLVGDPGFMQANWAVTVLCPRGSDSPVIFVKATNAIEMIRGFPVQIALAFYHLTKGGVFQVFVQVDSPEARAKFGCAFVAEHTRWPEEKEDREMIEKLLTNSTVEVCFVAPGKSGPCTGFFALRADIPEDCFTVLKTEWTRLQKHHISVAGPDFKASLEQYNRENPMEESPVLPRPDVKQTKEIPEEKESPGPGAIFKALSDTNVKEGDLLEIKTDGSFQKYKGGLGFSQYDLVELYQNGITKVGDIEITHGVYLMALEELEHGAPRKLTDLARDLINQKKNKLREKAKRRPKALSIFWGAVTALVGFYNATHPGDFGTPNWLHYGIAAATIVISFAAGMRLIKRFDVGLGIGLLVFSGATFLAPATLTLADFVIHLLLGTAFLIAAATGLPEQKATKVKKQVSRCDICGGTEQLGNTSAGQMRKAVSNGFDPFILKITSASFAKEDWTGYLAASNSWRICSRCSQLVNQYLSSDANKAGEPAMCHPQDNQARHLYWRGMKQVKQEAWADAVGNFKKAIQFEPDSPLYHYALAIARSKSAPSDLPEEKLKSYYLEVCAVFEKALKLDESRKQLDDEAYRKAGLSCGVLYRSLGRHDDALRAFESGLKRNPNDAELLAGCAWSQLDLGQLSVAENTASRLLNLEQSSDEARKLWKQIRHKQGKDLGIDLPDEVKRKIYSSFKLGQDYFFSQNITGVEKKDLNFEDLVQQMNESGRDARAQVRQMLLQEYGLKEYELDFILQQGEREAWPT